MILDHMDLTISKTGGWFSKGCMLNYTCSTHISVQKLTINLFHLKKDEPRARKVLIRHFTQDMDDREELTFECPTPLAGAVKLRFSGSEGQPGMLGLVGHGWNKYGIWIEEWNMKRGVFALVTRKGPATWQVEYINTHQIQLSHPHCAHRI